MRGSAIVQVPVVMVVVVPGEGDARGEKQYKRCCEPNGTPGASLADHHESFPLNINVIVRVSRFESVQQTEPLPQLEPSVPA